jgi:hypothetical protein
VLRLAVPATGRRGEVHHTRERARVKAIPP